MPINESPLTASPSPRINYRGDADSVDFAPAADTPAGTVVRFSGRLGVTKLDIPANEPGTLHLTGQFDFPKTAGTPITFDAPLKWDPAVTAADGKAGALVPATPETADAYCAIPGGATVESATVRAILA